MKSQTKNPRARRALAAAAILGITHSAAHAAIVSWNAPGGGAWSNLTWTGGVGTSPPQNIDTAAFNLNNTYNVNLNVSPTVFLVQVGGSNVTFIGSSGATVTSTGGLSVSSGSFTLAPTVPVTWNNGNTISFNANATVSNGSDMTAPGMGVGNGGVSTTTFTGSGTTLTLSGGIGVGNGNAGVLNFSNSAAGSATTVNIATSGLGSGTLNVQSNATLTTTNGINIGATSNGSATMTVVGGGAVTASGGDLNVNSTGLLDIQAGGSFSITNRAVSVNAGTGAQGKIKVGGAGASFFQTGAVSTTVGSGAGNIGTIQTTTGGVFSTGTAGLAVNSAGLVDIAGGTLTVNGNASIFGTLQRSGTGSFDWAASKAMTIQAGGQVNFTGGYALPVSASVLVSGNGSSLVQSTSGALTVSNGSELNIASNATVNTFAVRVSDGAAGLVNHSGGTHSITGGTNPLILGNSAGATGTYNLSGGGLWITNNQAGPGTIVGNNGTGSFVQSGGWQWITGSSDGITIGAGPTGVGTYAISSGSLDCGPMQIGRDNGATGTLTVSKTGASTTVVNSTGNIEMGVTAGASGTINVQTGGLVGGTGLFVGGSAAGPGGNGVVNITGGQVAITGPLRIYNTGTSVVNFSAGGLSCAELITAPSRFVWTGNGMLSITGPTGLTVGAGQPIGDKVTLSGGKSLGVSKTTTINGGAVVEVTGSGTFFTGGLSGAGALSSDGSYIFIGNMGQNTGSGQFTGSLTGNGGISKYGSGTQFLRNTRIANVAVHEGGLGILPTGGNSIGTSVVSNLTIDATCKLDLADNKLIVRNGAVGSWNGSAYTGLTGLIQSGRNNGAWQGSGLTTSMSDATTGILTTLAIGKASELGYGGGTFGGQSVGANDVLVMYTWGGDADLNGTLNGDDYFYLDAAIGQSGSVFGFHNGDFNYDGQLNGDDYFILDSNIAFVQNQQPFPTGAGAGGSSGLTAVPEPAGIAILAGLLGVYLPRRRTGGML